MTPSHKTHHKQTKIMFHITKFTLIDRIYPIECTYVRIEGLLWPKQILWAVKVRQMIRKRTVLLDDRKYEVIACLINVCMNVTANNFHIQNQGNKFRYLKYLLYSTEVLLDIHREYCSQIQVIDGEYIFQISKCIVEHVYGAIPLRFVKVRHKILLITKKKKDPL